MPNFMLLATAWGPKHGGINAFNMDFAHGLATHLKHTGTVFCAVLSASREDREDAQEQGIKLIPINKPIDSSRYDSSWAYDVWKNFRQTYQNDKIDWWVGHDVVSGAAAVEGPSVAEHGQTAVIMHMHYIAYSGYKHSSGVEAIEKDKQQREIFGQSHKHFAVGPLLRDAMRDMVDGPVAMLVPGFATITSRPSTAQLNLITFGRMDRESDRIKQGTLAVAGFASACRRAHDIPGLPRMLCENPQMRVIGIAQAGNDEERQLRQLAQEKAGRELTLLAQPFTENRDHLFDQLGRANLALMLSWHEGFGLTGWEAIAAQVPLIVSEQSGLYRLVRDGLGDPGIACLKSLDIRGREGDDDSANFTAEDEENVRDAILEMVRDQARWQNNAAHLKRLLEQELGCTWVHTARQFCEALGIDVQTPSEAPVGGLPDHGVDARPANREEVSTASKLIQIPHIQWPEALIPDIPDRFMLLPASATVPFHHHRNGRLQQHIEWALAGEQPIKLSLLAGAGGTGKTRLLIEVCRRLQADYGWQTGFLQPVSDLAQELRTLLREARGCLIVIDYAETRAKEVIELVRTAIRTEKLGPLRLTLLARDGGDWWEQLSEEAKDDPEVAAVLQSPRTRMGPYRMTEVDIEPDERPAIFREALAAFADKTGLEVPTIQMPDLTAPFFKHILFIHLAALATLRGRAITDHKELLVAILRHEREYWRRALGNAAVETDYLDGLEQLIALLTLIGGTRSAAETRHVINLTPRLREAAPRVKNQLFDHLRPLYGRNGGISGLQPDLLGERLVADSLAKDDELIDIVFKNSQQASERVRYAYTVLTRLARQDDHERQWLARALERHLHHTADDAMTVAMETGAPMPEMIVSVLQATLTSSRQKLVNTLRGKLPKDTVNLKFLAVRISKQHVEILAHKGNRRNFKARSNSKDAYDLLASRYEAIGRFNEAIGARQKALEFAQELSKPKTLSNRRMLAQVYRSLSVIYAKTGHFSEALDTSQQAERILCMLAQAQPAVYRPDWAGSLDNLGNRLNELGRYEEALERTQQAETIHRELAQAQPAVYRPDWATSLNNLGKRLSDLERYAEALEQAQQAETIRRGLAQAQPDVYRPDWAMSLGNLAEALLFAGDAHRALPQARRAFELYTALAARYPKTYQEQRGWCQRVLAEVLLETGALDEALVEAYDAVALLFEMFNDRPGYTPVQYGKALEVLSRCQRDREGITASIQTLRRAIQDLGPHYERHPAALQTMMQKIVESLHTLAPESGRHEVPQSILDLLDRHKT
jgi:tetratricopeptide (TPR) repeat protein/glycosyltransferase involved in cell wall biosynthesis